MKRDNILWETKEEITRLEKKLEGHDAIFKTISIYLKSISESLEKIASKKTPVNEGSNKIIEKIIEKPVIIGGSENIEGFSNTKTSKKINKKKYDSDDDMFIPDIDTKDMVMNKKAKKNESEEMDSGDVLGSVDKLGNIKK